jgi:fibronectin-binding autotransporter adhesin
MEAARSRFVMLGVIVSFALGFAATASAGTAYYWDPSASGNSTTGGGGTWDTNTSNLSWWNGADTDHLCWPSTTDYDAYFGGSSGEVNLNAGGVTAGGVNLATSGYTIWNGTISLGSGGISAPVTGSISTSVSLLCNQTWDVGSGSTLTVSGPVWGAATTNLVKTGAGILLIDGGLDGGNTFTGTTTISAGTLVFGNGVTSNGIFDCTNIVDNSALVFNRNASGTSSPRYTISGTGSVTQKGTRVIHLSYNNSYSGGTFIEKAQLRMNASSPTYTPLGSGSVTMIGGCLAAWTAAIVNNPIYIASNGTTSVITTSSVSMNRNLTLNGNFTGPSDGTATFSLGTTSSIVLGGSNSGFYGAFIFTPTNGYIYFSSANAGSENAKFKINSSTNYDVRSNIAGTSTIKMGELLGAGKLTNGSASTLVTYEVGALNTSSLFSGAILDNGTAMVALTKVGTGMLTLSGSNTYSGATAINAGTLAVGNGGSTGVLSSATVINNGFLSVNRTQTYVYGGVISGTGSVGKRGSGTLTLSGENTYSGTTSVVAGTLRVTGSIASSSSVSVAASAALTGYGTATAVDVASGGIVGSTADPSVWGGTWTFDSLNLAGDSYFYFGNIDAYISTAAITVTGTDTFASAGTINVGLYGTFSAGGTGSAHLIQYAGSPIALSYSLSTVTFANIRSTISLGTSTGGGLNYLDVNYSVNYPYWTALGDGLWTTATATTTNWKLASDDSMTDYINGDAVMFDDRVGVSAATVTLGENVTPMNVTFNNSSTTTYALSGGSGNFGIGGSASLTVSGSGTVTILNANTYTGKTSLNGGTLLLQNADAIGATGTILFNGGTLMYSSANTADYSARFSTAANQAFNINTNGQNVTFASGLSSTGGTLTKLGAGILTLTVSNSYSGATVISAGTLAVGAGSTTGTLASPVVNNGVLVFNRSNNYGFAYAVSGTGSLVQAGSGTLTLSVASSYTGNTILAAGTLRLANSTPNVACLGASGTLEMANGTTLINASSTSTVASAVAIAGGATVSIQPAYHLYLNGNITGGTDSTLSYSNPVGSCSLFLGGNNGGFQGTFDINATNGRFCFQNANAGSENARFVLTDASGTNTNGVYYSGTANGTVRMGELSGSGIIRNGMTGTNVTYEVGHLGTSSAFAGTITNTSGITSLTKVGAGMLTLTGDCSYTGLTTVSGGTLCIGDGNAVGSIVGNVSTGSGTATGTLAFNRWDAVTFGGSISGSGTVTHCGSGTLTLTANNTYTGGTNLVNGTLQVGDGTLTGALAGNVYTASATTLIFNCAAASSYGCSISGSGSVAKNGAAELTFSGSSNYAGDTSVNAGVLRVSGSIATSGINVAGGASLVLAGGTVGSVYLNSYASLAGYGTAGSVNMDMVASVGGTASNTWGKQLTVTSLNLPGSNNLNFGNVSAYTGTATVGIHVTQSGGLTISPTININIYGTVSGGTGTAHLIKYSGGTTTLGSYNLQSYSFANSRSSATLGTSTESGYKYVNLNYSFDYIYWTGLAGDGGIWSTGTASGNRNWKLASNNSQTDYFASDFVLFDDRVGGTSATVTLGESVTPCGVMFNNGTVSYTVTDGGTGREIGGAANLIKGGAGTVTILSNNTYSGETTICDGVLQVGDGGAAGSLGSGNVANNGVLVFNRSDEQSFGSVISGTGSVVKAGSGTLTLSADNTYSGGTLLNAGDLRMGGALPTSSVLGTGQVTLAGGTLTATSSTTIANNISLSAGASACARTSTTSSTRADVTWNGNITGGAGGTLTFTNEGNTLTYHYLGGNNSGFQGTFNFDVTASRIWFSSADAGSENAKFFLSGPTTDANYGVFSNVGAAGSVATIKMGELAGTGGRLQNYITGSTVTYEVGALNSNSTFAGILRDFNGVTCLTKIGTGTLTLTANHANTGAVIISAGAIQLGDGSFNNTGYFTNSLVVNNAQLVFNRSCSTGTYNFQPLYTISGTGSVKKLGNTTWDIQRANTFSGGTTLIDGRIRFSCPNPTDTALGSGTLTMLGGTIATTASAVVANATVVGDGASAFIRNSNDLTWNGNITGASSSTLSIIPTYTFYFGGNNSGFAGTFVLDCTSASIYFSNADAGSENAKFVTVASGGSSYIRTAAGPNTTIKMGELSGNGRLRNSNSGDYQPITYEVGHLGTDSEFSGVIVDGGNPGNQTNFTKVGAGRLILSSANTYTGATTVSGGTLAYGTDNATGPGNLSVGGATLDLSAYSGVASLVTLTNGGVIAGGTLTSDVGFSVASGVISASLAGSGTLTKSTAGTVTLSGANVYGGANYVNGGFLVIEGDAATAAVFGGTSTDIAAGKLVFDYAAGGSATGATISDQVKSILTTSYHGGTNSWASGVIHSTLANSHSTDSYALGWSNNTATSAVTVKVVLYGDATMDGTVNIYDLGQVLANYNKSGVWDTGDFNYDGTVNIYDLGTVLANYNKSLSLSELSVNPSDYAGLDGQGVAALQAAGINVVPEPGTLALLTAGAVGLLAYAWRRRKRFMV